MTNESHDGNLPDHELGTGKKDARTAAESQEKESHAQKLDRVAQAIEICFPIAHRMQEGLKGHHGLQDRAIQRRGYWIAKTAEEMEQAGFDVKKLGPMPLPAFMIPQYDVHGRRTHTVTRKKPTTPKAAPGTKDVSHGVIRSHGSPLRLDVSPCFPWELLWDPRVPIYWVDMPQTADALASHGLVVVDTPRLAGWDTPSVQADLLALPIRGREVILVGSNGDLKRGAFPWHLHIHSLARWLESEGAIAGVLDWAAADAPCTSYAGVEFLLKHHSAKYIESLSLVHEDWEPLCRHLGVPRCSRCWESPGDPCRWGLPFLSS